MSISIFKIFCLFLHTLILISNISYFSCTVHASESSKLAKPSNYSSSIFELKSFAATYLNTQGLNNSCLKSPASTLVDLTF